MHLCRTSARNSRASGFSPLLVGDGVASCSAVSRLVIRSVFQSPSRGGRCCISTSLSCSCTATLCFSPLLVGDGVASARVRAMRSVRLAFQSPSRGGRCCIQAVVMGRTTVPQFQSPSRGGRCCIPPPRTTTCTASSRFSPLLVGDGVASAPNHPTALTLSGVSVPFSWGTVLHHRNRRAEGGTDHRFQSPSRGGRCCIVVKGGGHKLRDLRFSPLLVGDGVASKVPDSSRYGAMRFQSPSRGGRCCISSR